MIRQATVCLVIKRSLTEQKSPGKRTRNDRAGKGDGRGDDGDGEGE